MLQSSIGEDYSTKESLLSSEDLPEFKDGYGSGDLSYSCKSFSEPQSLNSTPSADSSLFGDLPTPPLDSDNTDETDNLISVMDIFEDWKVGQRYKLVRMLGHGSYGQVAEAVDTTDGKKVAIKRIQNIFNQPVDARRVYREMFILRNIDHPNIIRLLNVVAPHYHELNALTSLMENAPNNSLLLDNIRDNTHNDDDNYYSINNDKINQKSNFNTSNNNNNVTNNSNNNNATNIFSYPQKRGIQTPSSSSSSEKSINDNMPIPPPNFSKRPKLTPKKRSFLKSKEKLIVDDIYLIFEFVDTDLYKLILSHQYLSTAHIQVFLHQLLLGLKYLQSAQVIHRDLKPANILVNEDCSLKICDFGLSRVVGLESMTYRGVGGESCLGVENSTILRPPKPLMRSLTRHVVTRWYRAPELILLQEYSAAVDVWSVGCVLAELLSMQIESVKDHEDRMPLFPGRSCPSLSGDGLIKTIDGKPLESDSDRQDQLSVIFDVIGSPTEDDILSIPDDNTKVYLRKFPKTAPKDFRTIYPGAESSALELLQHMLTFSPNKRISVNDALAHPFLTSVRCPESETIINRPIGIAMESVNNSIFELRKLVMSEIKVYLEKHN